MKHSWLGRLSPIILGSCQLLAACSPQDGGQSGAEALDDPEEPFVPEPSHPSPGGQDPNECEEGDDQVCIDEAERQLKPFGDTARAPSIVDRDCDYGGVILETTSVSGTFCNCEQDDGRVTMLGPVGLGCFVYGRAGDCLLSDDDFSGCEPDDASSCEASCQLLEERLASDADKTFDTEVIEAVCNGGSCTNVVRIGEQCYVDGSNSQGRAYDCDAGAEAIREQHAQDTAPPELIELPPEDANYLPDTNGTLSLGVYTYYKGTYREPPYFSARADFVTVEGSDGIVGEVLDPLEGIDDCGVTQRGNSGTAASVEWHEAAAVKLLDGDVEYDFEPIDVGFRFYALGLSDMGVKPRFGESYGFFATGATLSGAFETDRVHLPKKLEFEQLPDLTHLPQDDVTLRWSGNNDAPLQLRIGVVDTLADSFSPYEINCLLADDGEFVLPKEVLAAAPTGFVTLYARRRQREVVEDGDNAFLLEGEVSVEHRLAFGEPCDTPEVLDACLAQVEAERALREECGGYDPSLEPPIEVQCPDYLAHACNGCVEFFECKIDKTRCEDGGIVSYSGCSCGS